VTREGGEKGRGFEGKKESGFHLKVIASSGLTPKGGRALKKRGSERKGKKTSTQWRNQSTTLDRGVFCREARGGPGKIVEEEESRLE